MHDLRDAHRGLSTILLHQPIRIIQCPPGTNYHFHSSLSGQLYHLRIPISPVRICILFEHQMGDMPGLEQLRKERLRCFSNDKELGFGVELGDGGREVILAI